MKIIHFLQRANAKSLLSLNIYSGQNFKTNNRSSFAVLIITKIYRYSLIGSFQFGLCYTIQFCFPDAKKNFTTFIKEFAFNVIAAISFCMIFF